MPAVMSTLKAATLLFQLQERLWATKMKGSGNVHLSKGEPHHGTRKMLVHVGGKKKRDTMQTHNHIIVRSFLGHLVF
jgi:hypothetical protein